MAVHCWRICVCVFFLFVCVHVGEISVSMVLRAVLCEQVDHGGLSSFGCMKKFPLAVTQTKGRESREMERDACLCLYCTYRGSQSSASQSSNLITSVHPTALPHPLSRLSSLSSCLHLF